MKKVMISGKKIAIQLIIITLISLCIIGGIRMSEHIAESRKWASYPLQWTDQGFAQTISGALRKELAEVTQEDISRITYIKVSDKGASIILYEDVRDRDNLNQSIQYWNMQGIIVEGYEHLHGMPIKCWDDLALFPALWGIEIEDNILLYPSLNQVFSMNLDLFLTPSFPIVNRDELEIIKDYPNIRALYIRVRFFDNEDLEQEYIESVLSGFQSLQELRIENVHSIDFVAELKQLKVLWIDFSRSILPSTEINLSPVSNLSNLRQLVINTGTSVNPLSLEQLSNLSNLEILSIQAEFLPTLKGIEGLRQVRSIAATSCLLEDISAIRGLANLEHLYLEGNLIQDISALRDLNRLVHINLIGNEIVDFSPLANKPLLEELYILGTYGEVGNIITEDELLKILPTLPKLEWLMFSGEDTASLMALVREQFPHINLTDKDLELAARNSAIVQAELAEARQAGRDPFAPTSTQPPASIESQSTEANVNDDAMITPMIQQTQTEQSLFPPVTYPIYLARTYPDQTGHVIVYSIGYSADNLIAKFGINSNNHEPYRISIKENIDDDAYQIALKGLHEFVMSHPEQKYPHKLVIGQEGILESVV